MRGRLNSMRVKSLSHFGLFALSMAWILPAEAPHTRAFSMRYTATVSGIPSGTKQFDFWMPVPHDDPYQHIESQPIDSNYPVDIATDALGNRILHVRLSQPAEESMQLTLRFQATRREHRQDLLRVAAGPHDASSDETGRWLKPDRLVPLDDQIRTWAREVVDAAHATTDVEKARAIYNHVVSTVKYDKKIG